MPNTIERPIFTEGQILGADDLKRMLDYSRQQEARHARCSHLWGIAEGLTVTATDNLEIAPGLAIDSSGGPIVVAQPRFLSVEDFTGQLTKKEASGTYPLFLLSTRSAAPGRSLVGRCGRGSQTREIEGADLRFERPTALSDWDKQDPPGIADGPDDSLASTRRVLLGFVVWDLTRERFTGFVDAANHGNREYRRRYAGVRADDVESFSGRMTLRTGPSAMTDAPLVVLDGATPARSFAFGLDDGHGGIKPLVWIDKDGNLDATGVIGGASSPRAGDVLVQSGIVADGLCLPLPDGVKDEQVRSGRITLHAMVTPSVQASARPTPGTWLPTIPECSVDGDRRVSCRITWLNIGAVAASSPLPTQVLPGVCDYLIMATVSTNPGATS